MMLYLYVLQNQWIVLSLVGGVILTLLLCLTYQALWVPRGTEAESEKIEVKDLRSFFVWIKSFVPWTITLLIIGSLAFTLFEIAENHAIPPNW